jgi:hypothetical protein
MRATSNTLTKLCELVFNDCLYFRKTDILTVAAPPRLLFMTDFEPPGCPGGLPAFQNLLHLDLLS